ncbi:MAG: hypothetical protein ACR2NM_13640 [Bythopirellula sp.]
MNPHQNQTWLPVAMIAGALLVWMGLLAFGAYSAPVGQGEGGDFRKLWVVAATTGGFLLLWGFVLLVRQRKLNRQQATNSEDNATQSTDD